MLSNGRFLCKKVDSLPKVFSTKSSVRQCKTQAGKQVVIPPRIKRGPTDILKELAATVNVDPTAFHYKFLDDPYFYPYSLAEKKVYGLCMESGRRSAKWIIKENAGLFKHQLAEPPIKAFIPEKDPSSESECTEQTLLEAIEERNVMEAIKVYKVLKEEKQDVAKSTKQSLLELVCFFNSEERPDLEPEERWLDKFLGRAGANLTPKTWNSRGFAASLFEDMDQDCPLAHSAVMQGMLKHQEIREAVRLFEAARVKRMQLPVEVYNYFLAEAASAMTQGHMTSEFVKNILSEMAQRNVRPNLGTLNAALKSLAKAREAGTAVKLVKEFLDLGIRPSLGSFGYLFRVIGRMRGGKNEAMDGVGLHRVLVKEVFDFVEDEDHEVRHPSDYEFFINAIEAFSEGMEDPDLAMRLFQMYLKPRNRKFVVRGAHDHGFYKELMKVLFRKKPIDFSMDVYRRYALTVFTPAPATFMIIVSALRENFASEYLPEIWEHIRLCSGSENRLLLRNIVESIDTFTDESSLKVFHKAATGLLKVFVEEKRFSSGDENCLPHILTAFLKNDDEENLLQALEFIKNRKLQFLNIKEELVEACVEYGLTKKNVPLIVESLRLAQREEIPGIGDLSEKALPLLSGEDEAFAKLLARFKNLGGTRKDGEESGRRSAGREEAPSEGGTAAEGSQE